MGGAVSGLARAGAPTPSRALSEREVIENIEFFTAGLTTTRTRPCHSLVLSGCEDGPPLQRAVEFARQAGIHTVTLHGEGPVSLRAVVDAVALRVGADLRVPTHPRLTAVLPLSRDIIQTEGLAERVADVPCARFVLLWPYPGGVAVSSLDDALAWAEKAARRPHVVMRGVPPCRLPAWAKTVSPYRTTNRYYVDADHQLETALLFFPDVVQFSKPDSCRQCSLTNICDGVALRWLAEDRIGRLTPICAEMC